MTDLNDLMSCDAPVAEPAFMRWLVVGATPGASRSYHHFSSMGEAHEAARAMVELGMQVSLFRRRKYEP